MIVIVQRYSALAAAALAACAPLAHDAPPRAATAELAPAEDEPAWRAVATDADELRLGRLDEAWTKSLAAARRRFGSAVQREGALLDPAAALPRPAPPPGSYHCRLITLGGPASLTAYKPFFCYVEAEGELLTFVKQTGSQRPAGRIYVDTAETRLIFLGTMVLNAEKQPKPYGEMAARDLVGVVERVGPFRYRLAMPFPREGAALDVFELVPALP